MDLRHLPESDEPGSSFQTAPPENLADACQQLQEANDEIESIYQNFEEALERSNLMAVEAEIAKTTMNQIFNATADAMWMVDVGFRVQRINDAMLKLLDKTYDEAMGKKCNDLLQGPLCDTPQCPLQMMKSGKKRVECDMELCAQDGKRTPYILTANAFFGFDGEMVGIVTAFKDITARKKAEAALQKANAELQYMAAMDGLTQVANRRRFDEVIKLEWSRLNRDQGPLSLILCDIDYFKFYNDTYGHQQGDDCLRAVAGALQKSIGRPSDLVARYGGEEFGIILSGSSVEGAAHIAEKIRKNVESLEIEHCKSKACRYVSISLGVTCTDTTDGADVRPFIEAADQALYAAKENGRNCFTINLFPNPAP